MRNVLMMGLTPPLEGGSERHIYEVSKRVKDSEVLTQTGSACENKEEVWIARKPQIAKSLSFLVMSFIYSIKLLATFNKRYELIHIHENLLYFLIPILKIRYKVVVTVHGIKGFKFYDWKPLWFLFKTALSFADLVIAVNKQDEKELSKYFKNVLYIPNGVDLSVYKEASAKTQDKIVFIGRVHEQKGIVYLLKAFEMIKEKHPEFKLEIVGAINEYAEKLKKEFSDERITWKGFVSDRKEIAKILSSAYVIAMPSLWEGLPLTLFEAFASKRPVVVSDIEAYKAVIKDEALFSKVKNERDLAEKILWCIENKKAAEKMGMRGAELAKDYDWKEIAKKLENAYNEV